LGAHRKNIRYLIDRNFLEGGKRRAIGIAGTSLVHHLDSEEWLEAMEVTGKAALDNAIVIAGLVATPPAAARLLVERCMELERPPDYFLLMPIPGVCNPAGIASEFEALARRCGESHGARFILYMRSSDLLNAYADLLRKSPHIVGVKIGTREQDVAEMLSRVPAEKKVLWGVGDRAAAAARLGSRGHTSGITLICPRLCDEIHNAYMQEKFDESARLEDDLAGLEEVRFMEGRAYNYSAVLAAARLAGFEDVDLGDGGPFNADPPPEIMQRIAACAERLKPYH
jgi:dihydrodipicolinate synthase/N-acetylneuraminate lyase